MPNFIAKFFARSCKELQAIFRGVANLPYVCWLSFRLGRDAVMVDPPVIADPVPDISFLNLDSESGDGEDMKKLDVPLELATLKQIFAELKRRDKRFVYAEDSPSGKQCKVFLGTEDLVDAVVLGEEILDTVLEVLISQGIDDPFVRGLGQIIRRFEKLFSGK